MAGKVGKNSVSLANDVRPFVCEFFGGEDGITVTNATLFEDNADATFSLSNQPVDPAYSQLCSVEIALAGLGDETADGDVSTSCDAEVTDIETGKIKNLEPGGNYLLEVPMGQAVPQFRLDVPAGTVVVICGMFCSQVNTKSLAVVASSANLLGIAQVKACIAEEIEKLPCTSPWHYECVEGFNGGDEFFNCETGQRIRSHTAMSQLQNSSTADFTEYNAANDLPVGTILLEICGTPFTLECPTTIHLQRDSEFYVVGDFNFQSLQLQGEYSLDNGGSWFNDGTLQGTDVYSLLNSGTSGGEPEFKQTHQMLDLQPGNYAPKWRYRVIFNNVTEGVSPSAGLLPFRYGFRILQPKHYCHEIAGE